MHRDDRLERGHELRDSVGRRLRPHCEVVAYADHGDVRLPEVVDDAHVAEHVGVPSVVDGVLPVGGVDDPGAGLPGELAVVGGGVQCRDEGRGEAPADGDGPTLVEADELLGGDPRDGAHEVDEVEDGVELGGGVLLEELDGVAKVVVVPVGEEDGGGVVLAKVGKGFRTLGVLDPWVDVDLLPVPGDAEGCVPKEIDLV